MSAALSPPLNRPWLYSIGWSKTGSNSLAAALNMLGLRAIHLGMESTARIKAGLPDRRHDIWRRYADDPHADPLAGFFEPGTAPDCLLDWPIHVIWPRLFAQDAQSKFLVTYRNPHDTALSYLRMAHQFYRVTSRDKWYTDYDKIVRLIEEHYSQALRHLVTHPDRFLIVDLKDPADYKWRTLKKFLGPAAVNAAAISDQTPWPHVFGHHEYYGLPSA
jgi:hypothetical protein